MTEKKVCVVLVNYNTTKDTLECIESLNKIDYHNYEIIVVDNASSDELTELERLNEKKQIILLHAVGNLGFAGGNNIGIEYAIKTENADYVLMLNNDTVVKKDFLTRLVKEAEADKEAGMICGTILRYEPKDEIWYKGGSIDLKKAVVKHWGYGQKNEAFTVEKQYVTFATGCLWLMPKRTLETVGLLTEDYFMYGEDADYCLRFTEKGLKILFVPEAVIWHKVGRSSKVSDTMQYYMVRNDFIVFSRFISENRKWMMEKRLLFQRIKDVLRGRIALQALVRGYMDYKRGVTGKME